MTFFNELFPLSIMVIAAGINVILWLRIMKLKSNEFVLLVRVNIQVSVNGPIAWYNFKHGREYYVIKYLDNYILIDDLDRMNEKKCGAVRCIALRDAKVIDNERK